MSHFAIPKSVPGSPSSKLTAAGSYQQQFLDYLKIAEEDLYRYMAAYCWTKPFEEITAEDVEWLNIQIKKQIPEALDKPAQRNPEDDLPWNHVCDCLQAARLAGCDLKITECQAGSSEVTKLAVRLKGGDGVRSSEGADAKMD